jgi:hypothetical protein
MATKKILINGIKVLLSTLVVICLGGCITYFGSDGPYEGKVIDAETGQPIEGAVIHGLWYMAHPGPGGATHTVYSSREVLTDANGHFNIPGQGLLFFSNLEPMDVTILKAGYTQIYDYIWGFTDTKGMGVELLNKNMAVFKLRRMTLEERKKRSITMPVIDSSGKMKLLRKESNREKIEMGLTSEYLYPTE